MDDRTLGGDRAAKATVVVVSNDQATVEPIVAALEQAGVPVTVRGTTDYQKLLEMLPVGAYAEGGRNESDVIACAGSTPTPLAEAKTRFERTYLERLLAQTQGNLAQAARLASVDRSNLRRLLKRHGIEAGVWRRR